MSTRDLGALLAQHWLNGLSPFDQSLRDTGRRYQGWPVFEVRVYVGGKPLTVKVYRCTPPNSEASYLRFVPDGALLSFYGRT